MTDVSVVSDRVLLETATFPVGKRTILRNLSRTLSTTADEALSLIRLSAEKRLSGAVEKRVGKTFLDSDNIWVTSFEKVLAEIATHTGIQSALFVSADDDLLPYFTTLVKREGFAQRTMTDELFSVFPLSSAVLYSVCQFDRESAHDPFLMLESAFASKLFTLS